MTAKLASLSGIEYLDPERRPFIESISDAPDDDAPLLIYADWLDEHNEDGALVRWWIMARREYVPTIIPGNGEANNSHIVEAARALFDQCGQSACVLSTVVFHKWQEKSHPIDWEAFRQYHLEHDELRHTIEATWLAVELSGMQLLTMKMLDTMSSSACAAHDLTRSPYGAARKDSAYVAWYSALAAGNSASAAKNSVDAARCSADSVTSSVNAAWSSVCATGISAHVSWDTVYPELERIALATFKAKWWAEIPGGK